MAQLVLLRVVWIIIYSVMVIFGDSLVPVEMDDSLGRAYTFCVWDVCKYELDVVLYLFRYETSFVGLKPK